MTLRAFAVYYTLYYRFNEEFYKRYHWMIHSNKKTTMGHNRARISISFGGLADIRQQEHGGLSEP